MSDKTYWLNKHLKRQYAKSDFIRADGGQAPAWVSTVTIVAIAALIMGIMTYVSEKSTTWLIVSIVAGVATVGTFLYTKIKETTGYTEFILNYKDQEIMFQYIGKKHIVVACNGKIFEFKNRQVNKVDSIYRPYASLNALTEVLYDTRERKGDNVVYFGQVEKEESGKKVVYKYKVKLGKDNAFETYTVNGSEAMFTLLKKGEQKLNLPINLYNEVRSAGVELPGDDIITIVYNY